MQFIGIQLGKCGHFHFKQVKNTTSVFFDIPDKPLGSKEFANNLLGVFVLLSASWADQVFNGIGIIEPIKDLVKAKDLQIKTPLSLLGEGMGERWIRFFLEKSGNKLLTFDLP